ncbi:hypothetical protein LF1_10060 [Rubripirellula obstinata]|uniref:Uncharacterized protein n=1 Tax=Rubripirellula obstinata TaxID=406547 RepID=A0A5B1CD43_9BACT|nr:hypothetical protein [Rubripirellula obstinata]KAA1258486.1 hypothetical protein LF1_10060 [Rubripirellula obstinata]
MSLRPSVVVYALIISVCMPTVAAVAQRGSLIEDLFRTVAEAQMQKERAKQLERSQARRRPVPQPSPNAVPLPRQPGQINVGNRQLADFAQTLSSFNEEIGFLITDLQPHARSHSEIRPILPAVYQISNQASAVLRACDGQNGFDPIIDRYSAFDSQWRTLSFQLRSAGSLTPEMQSRVRACDRFVSRMGNQMGVPPQMDRHALHDQMIIAATYMQSLLDDFDAANLPRRNAHRWAHDGRLLRQELLRTADDVELISYEEMTTRFSDFATRWGQYSAPISELGNPYLNRRLDRIAQCGEETYALLWMRPPTNTRDLSMTVASLKRDSSELMDQLTLRTLTSLDRNTRERMEQGTRSMYDEVKHLEDAIRVGSGTAELREHFVQYDRAWLSIRETTGQISRINDRLVEAIDRNCAKMRRTLRVQSPGPAPVRADELVGIAASLEGSAEYFKADIDRYEQYFTPAGFRRSITRAADDFHEASKRLHAGLYDQTDMRLLSRDANDLVDAWQRLSRDVANLRNQGLTGRRANNLENAAQNLAPLVAKVGAALL